MFSHVMVGANDLAKSKAFYDAVLGTLGIAEPAGDGRRYFYRGAGSNFGIGAPIDGDDACHANGGTIGFAAPDTAAVDAFHAAGIANGGTACENPPGIRENAFGTLYLAYLRDPDGNKICALHRAAK